MISISRRASWIRNARPWCEVCGRRVPWMRTERGFIDATIEVFSRCHGLEAVTVLDELVIEDLTFIEQMQIVAFKLAPRMLEAIRPEPPARPRGRYPQPEPAGVVRVFLAPPMELAA